ncbi:MAG: DUF3179 domain-containing (seleno)protein [Actinomycetota bacterium]
MRRFFMPRLATLIAVFALLATACSSRASDDAGTSNSGSTTTDNAATPATDAGEAISTSTGEAFPPAPDHPTTTELSAAVEADLDALFASLTGDVDLDALERLGESGDARLAWLFMDIQRFISPGSNLSAGIVDAFESVTGSPISGGRSAWGTGTDYLLAWDTPAPPDYVRFKRIIFELIEPGWQPFFADDNADIDWRWVSWGGVLIDDRPLDQTAFGCPEGCIPALNDPGLVQAGTDDDWLDDERIVFGIEVDGEAVAFPRNIMEIHEMVNMTVAGRRIGMPYCTLCGSAQAYYTDILDQLPDDDSLAALDDQASLELRTSGLLSRSNKVMYEFHTKSVFDTFTGAAVSGPLQDTGIVLEQLSVVTTTWADWKAEHPDSFLIAEDGGIGRLYQEDPLRGRDDNGPIFPIGTVDPRLDVQQPVVGVITDDGTIIAFPVDLVTETLDRGGDVTADGITVNASAGGFVAVDERGNDVATHQAFWFAWSQFHPDTLLWLG